MALEVTICEIFFGLLVMEMYQKIVFSNDEMVVILVLCAWLLSFFFAS